MHFLHLGGAVIANAHCGCQAQVHGLLEPVSQRALGPDRQREMDLRHVTICISMPSFAALAAHAGVSNSESD